MQSWEREVYVLNIEKHILQSNENGARLINFTASRDMITVSSILANTDIDKDTWIVPDRGMFIK